VGVTESESDDSEAQESGEHASDSSKDCEVIGGKEAAMALEEAGNTNGKRAATAGTEAEASPKKTKSTMTLSRGTDVSFCKFKPSPSKVDKKCKIPVRPCPRQGCVHQKEWRAKGRCQAGPWHIEMCQSHTHTSLRSRYEIRRNPLRKDQMNLSMAFAFCSQ